ncbi:MAG: hypothetical protein WKF96_06470, partial [Solirubrobacteraceae bacterium]
CVRGPFWVRVRGANIASVTFSVDGKRRSTVHAKLGRTVYTLLIKPARQTLAVHRVTARVRYTAASGRDGKTLRLVYQRCGRAAAVTPQFTG